MEYTFEKFSKLDDEHNDGGMIEKVIEISIFDSKAEEINYIMSCKNS